MPTPESQSTRLKSVWRLRVGRGNPIWKAQRTDASERRQVHWHYYQFEVLYCSKAIAFQDSKDSYHGTRDAHAITGK